MKIRKASVLTMIALLRPGLSLTRNMQAKLEINQVNTTVYHAGEYVTLSYNEPPPPHYVGGDPDPYYGKKDPDIQIYDKSEIKVDIDSEATTGGAAMTSTASDESSIFSSENPPGDDSSTASGENLSVNTHYVETATYPGQETATSTVQTTISSNNDININPPPL